MKQLSVIQFWLSSLYNGPSVSKDISWEGQIDIK